MLDALLLTMLVQTASLASGQPSFGPSVSNAAPRLAGEATYVSTETATDGIKTRLDVTKNNFSYRAVGHSPDVGRGSHDGGSIRVEEGEASYYLTGVGISLPKGNARKWTMGTNATCERLDLSDDVYSSVCTRFDDKQQFGTLFSRTRGVLSFTGHCWMQKDRVCHYVLISQQGLAAR